MNKKMLVLMLAMLFLFNLSGCWVIANKATGTIEPVNEIQKLSEEKVTDDLVEEDIKTNTDIGEETGENDSIWNTIFIIIGGIIFILLVFMGRRGSWDQ